MKVQQQSQKMRHLLTNKLPKITTDHSATEHFYVHNEIKYPSVSAPLGWIKKAELGQYGIRRTVDYVATNWKKFDENNINEHLVNMANESERLKTTAGNTGTRVHYMRELAVDYWFANGSWPQWQAMLPVTGEETAGIRSWLRFADECKYIPVLCETSLVDPVLGVGGSLDDVGYVNGELCLVDLKTSNQIKQYNYYLQTSKYLQMLKYWSKCRAIKKVYILGVSKVKAEYKLIEVPTPKRYAKEYDMLFKLWQAKKGWSTKD